MQRTSKNPRVLISSHLISINISRQPLSRRGRAGGRLASGSLGVFPEKKTEMEAKSGGCCLPLGNGDTRSVASPSGGGAWGISGCSEAAAWAPRHATAQKPVPQTGWGTTSAPRSGLRGVEGALPSPTPARVLAPSGCQQHPAPCSCGASSATSSIPRARGGDKGPGCKYRGNQRARERVPVGRGGTRGAAGRSLRAGGPAARTSQRWWHHPGAGYLSPMLLHFRETEARAGRWWGLVSQRTRLARCRHELTQQQRGTASRAAPAHTSPTPAPAAGGTGSMTASPSPQWRASGLQGVGGTSPAVLSPCRGWHRAADAAEGSSQALFPLPIVPSHTSAPPGPRRLGHPRGRPDGTRHLHHPGAAGGHPDPPPGWAPSSTFPPCGATAAGRGAGAGGISPRPAGCQLLPPEPGRSSGEHPPGWEGMSWGTAAGWGGKATGEGWFWSQAFGDASSTGTHRARGGEESLTPIYSGKFLRMRAGAARPARELVLVQFL